MHQNSALSPAGILERTFTFAFRSMVYPQIWEDPRADMEALELTPQSRMLTIASGGCNVMSYLTANPARIYAIDLNETHIALLKLKIAAAQHLPNHATFFAFSAQPTITATSISITISSPRTSTRIRAAIGKAAI